MSQYGCPGLGLRILLWHTESVTPTHLSTTHRIIEFWDVYNVKYDQVVDVDVDVDAGPVVDRVFALGIPA